MGRELRGLPILITGASSGIGRATALACARAGMPVAVAARRADRLHDLVSEIEASGGRAVAIECDVADAGACGHAVAACVEQFGSIYAAFANAGYGTDSFVHTMSDSELRRMFEVNFFGTMSIARAAWEWMIPAGRGHILICSSCLARFPVPGFGAYCATKAAQHHMARAMRAELHPLGIEVSSIHPIGTKTEFFDVAKTPDGVILDSRSSEPFMQTADFVASRIVNCLRKPRAEVWPGVNGKLVRIGMAVAAATPGLTDALFRRVIRRKLAKAKR